MSSFKKLYNSDVTYVPYTANKQWSFNSVDGTGSYYSVYVGTEISGSSSYYGTLTNGQYEGLVYDTINHMFYQAYEGELLNTQSLMMNVNTYLSASEQRPTNSYFDYDVNDKLIKNFPTGSGEKIKVLVVNKNTYGSKILPYTFITSASSYYITDDGNGNLYSSSVHIGNIFYSQGIIIITNQNNQSVYSGSYSFSFKNEHIIYENEIRCIVRESDYNTSYNPTLSTGSNGILRDFATGSDFHPYVTTVGLYNDNNELLMVAKLAKPIMISPHTDVTFIIKYDN